MQTAHEKMRAQLLEMMEELNQITDKDCKKMSKDGAKDKIERARAMIDVARALTDIDRVEIEEKKQLVNAVNSMSNLKRAGIDMSAVFNGNLSLIETGFGAKKLESAI